MKKLMVLALAVLMLAGVVTVARADYDRAYELSTEYKIIPGENVLEITVYFENNLHRSIPFDYRVRFLANSYPYSETIPSVRYELAGMPARVVPGFSKTLVLHLSVPLATSFGNGHPIVHVYNTIGEEVDTFETNMIYGKAYSMSFDIVKDPADGKGALASLTQLVKIPRFWTAEVTFQKQPLVWQDGSWIKSY